MTMNVGDNPWWEGTAPFDESPLAPIEHTTRYEFQRGRFNGTDGQFNTTDLKNYVCWHISAYRYTDYYPVCSFPYINKGWYMDGKNGESGEDWFADVVPNDCSLLIHDAFGKGWNSYDAMCMRYCIISSLAIPVCIYFLKVFNEMKGKKAKKGLTWLLPSNLNIGEKLLFINLFMACVCTVFALDPNAYRDTIPLYSQYLISRTTLIGFLAVIPNHILMILATSWITVVDGGQKRRTPPWAKWLARFEYSILYFSEIILAQYEFRSGDALNYSFGINNQVNIWKQVISLQQTVVYFLISLNYGNKIKRMLKGNTKDAEESQELKKIKRFMRVCMSMYFFISFGRVTSILTACVFTDDERCRTNNVSIPPCDYIPQWWAIAGPWIGGWAILYANQPGKKKYTTRLIEKVRSTMGSSASRSRASTGRTSKGSSKSNSSKSNSNSSKNSSSSNSKNSSSTGSSVGGSSTGSGSYGSSVGGSSAASSAMGSDFLSSESSGTSSYASEGSLASELGSEFELASGFESAVDGDGGNGNWNGDDEEDENHPNYSKSKVVPHA